VRLRERSTWKPTLSLAVPDQVLLHDSSSARIGPRRRGVVEVDDEGPAGRGLQGDFAEGRGEGGEELLGELFVLNESVRTG
jgi:hypothetical protein